MNFFPTDIYTTWYALILLVSVVAVLWISKKTNRNIAVIMFSSWLLARTATLYDDMTIQIIGTFVLALLVFQLGTKGSTLVACLFGFKLLIYASFIDNRYMMWTYSEVCGYLQMIIMSMGSLDDRFSRLISRFRWISSIGWINRPSRIGVYFLAISQKGLQALGIGHRNP